MIYSFHVKESEKLQYYQILTIQVLHQRRDARKEGNSQKVVQEHSRVGVRVGRHTGSLQR